MTQSNLTPPEEDQTPTTAAVSASSTDSTAPGDVAQMTERWVTAYLTAWSSNRADDITALFTEDASYFTEPYSDPWVGHQAIVDGWLEHADGPDSFTFEWVPLVLSAELSAVQGVTTYAEGTVYSNLWLIRFAPDGRAREFTEWWMDQAHSSDTD